MSFRFALFFVACNTQCSTRNIGNIKARLSGTAYFTPQLSRLSPKLTQLVLFSVLSANHLRGCSAWNILHWIMWRACRLPRVCHSLAACHLLSRSLSHHHAQCLYTPALSGVCSFVYIRACLRFCIYTRLLSCRTSTAHLPFGIAKVIHLQFIDTQ